MTTAKITKAASTAKNEKQEKIMRAGRAGPFHIRKGKSMHRLMAREVEMMIWVVRVRRVGGEVQGQIFSESGEDEMRTRREEKYVLCAGKSSMAIYSTSVTRVCEKTCKGLLKGSN
jgi:hypothetical protein